MAIEHGLHSLTYITSTSKYLQQCKVCSSVTTITNNWLLISISSPLKSHVTQRWQSTTVGADAQQGCHDTLNLGLQFDGNCFLSAWLTR